MATDTRRRVKLYALNADRQWDDRGTGHVSSTYVERLKGISLLVRAEADGSLLLESKIQPDTAYQKQQDTLIVWSEGDNFDLALSFQEKAGCDEIWEKICHVQGKDPSVDITQDIVEESEDERFDETSDSAPPIELPPCELARLEDISEAIASGLTTPLRKEKLAMALETDGYIKKLLALFSVCEDLGNADGLHHLYEIFKNIFLLNKNALFEIMFAEDTIFDVVGCLEYETGNVQDAHPRRHRQYLRSLSRFREALPIRSPDLLAKIHQTYRVQYIQDIILPTPSVFVEDNMLNTLSSFIFFNKVEIVTLIQEDEKYLVDMFAMLTDPATEDAKRRDIVLFLKEFCNFAQNLQAHGKDAFYKTLTMLGVLPALEITLVMADQRTKAASIDILTAIVEYSPCIVRNYTLQQVNKTDEEHMLMNIAIEQMLSDSEPELGGAVQIMGVVRILLDPENMITEKNDFLNFFYKHSIQTLIAPLLMNTLDDKPQNEDYQTVQLLGLVLELLSFCVEHHSYHMKNCILQKDLLKRILVLMKSTHTFLVLGSLRLLRKIISLKDEFYNRHIVKGNLFAPVVDAFIRNNGRYNLLESAILELFEFIKVEDIKSLCTYVVENFTKIFDEIEYVQTFKHLKGRYEQHQEMLKERDKLLDSIPMIRNITRYKRDQRQLEEEEEIWFNEEEDFTEVPAAKPEIESYSMMKNKLASEKANNGPASAGAKSTSNAATSPPSQSQLDCHTGSSAVSSSPPQPQHQQLVVTNLAATVAALDASITAEMLGAAAAAAAAALGAAAENDGRPTVAIAAAADDEATTTVAALATAEHAVANDVGLPTVVALQSVSAVAGGIDDDDDNSSSAFVDAMVVVPAAAATAAATASIAADATDLLSAAASSISTVDSSKPATATAQPESTEFPAHHPTMDVDATPLTTATAAAPTTTTPASAVPEAETVASTSPAPVAGDDEAANGKEASAAAGSLKKYLVDYGGDSDDDSDNNAADDNEDDASSASESPTPLKKARIL